MSDTNIETGRDAKTGRFQPGNKPLGHRPLGSKIAIIEHLQDRIATRSQRDDDSLQALTSIPEVLAYVATAFRAEGKDEADAVELAVRAAELSPRDVRAAERVLRAMGYRVVADRLKALVGRRKISLVPLP